MSATRFQTFLHHLRRAACGSADGVSDADLLRRFAATRDETAFELLVWRHGSAVWTLCRRLLRDEQDAHDAFQAAFLALARSAASVGKRGSVGGWLYRVACRAALAARARAARRAAREQPLGHTEACDPSADAHAAAVAEELRQALAEEVSRLPERFRLPLVLCGFAGKSNPEAARELGCPLGTLESRLTRARQRLRARLARRGFALGAVAAALAIPTVGYAAFPPAPLVSGVVRIAAGGASKTVPAGVAALAGQAVRIPLMTKLKVSSLLAVVCTGLVAWAALPLPGGGAGKPAAQGSSLVPGKANTLRLTREEVTRLGLRVGQVPPPTPVPPRRLELTGTLTVDVDRQVRVGTRFPGEILEIGKAEGADGRPLRFGDRVAKGQVLAVLWCKDLAEKKAALLDGLMQLRLDRVRLERLEKAYAEGSLPEAVLREGQRAVQMSLNIVRAAERSLRIWKVDDGEIETLRREAEELAKNPANQPADAVKAWARVPIRAPIAGTVVERNAIVGQWVDPTVSSVFVVADLRTLQVTVRAPEAELPVLKALKPEARRWSIRVAADPDAGVIEGRFDRIAPELDPKDQTVLLSGQVPNAAGKLRPGQLVKVTVLIPRTARFPAIPAAALVEAGGKTFVFVQPDPKQEIYRQRRVAVVHRAPDGAHIREVPTPEESRQGVEGLRPGERIVTAGAVELQGLLEGLKAQGK
jgi:cobalt-zinc-cadmium efflux system membrane fusion protein